MKKLSQVILISILILVLALTGCGGGSGGGGNSGGGNDGDGNSGGGGGNPGGDSGGSSSYNGVAFTMIDVPSWSYEIAQTEVTYELWSAVYTWALANGYNFFHAGTKGSSGSGSDQQPVTNVNWIDAIVWCNALTEYYAAKGGTSYKCVYYNDANYQTPMRDSDTTNYTPYIFAAATGNQDMPGCTANGFRLPTSDELHQAAGYIDGSAVYPDNYASGADAAFDAIEAPTDIDGDGDYRLTSDVARYSANSGGSTWPVKSKSPNKLGLYDMSGNVWEICFNDTGGGRRFAYGGSWQSSAADLRASWYFGSEGNPYHYGNVYGFRPVRTK